MFLVPRASQSQHDNRAKAHNSFFQPTSLKYEQNVQNGKKEFCCFGILQAKDKKDIFICECESSLDIKLGNGQGNLP
jgi:hypothetical protein